MISEDAVQVPRPSSLAHVVLRTSNYENMVDFYLKFLGAKVTYKNDTICFLRYDEEHHRIAIIRVPGTGPKVPTSAGLEHIAFAFDGLEDLLSAYQARKVLGMEPSWCVNHGPTTSIYYKDPDGNSLETQVDNFSTAAEADDFMRSKYFDENPIGTDFRPEDLVKRLSKGESPAAIKQRIEIGPRGLPEGF